MPVHRERVDPIRTPAQLEVCHRRWLLPDDVGRAVTLPQAARLWRGLIDLGVLDASSEAELDRLRLPAIGEGDHSDLPADWFAMQAARARGELVTLPGGHFFLQEGTARAERLVREHLGA